LANLKLREELKSQSIRDTLTGLFNRRFLEETLEKEVAIADRKKGKLAVLMIDIDHFKEFNDKFGHEAGDRVLSEIGSLVNRSVRKGDVACRYGGEELVLLLPDTGLAESRKTAEKLRESVKQLTVTYRNASLGKITVSVGASVYPEDGRTSTDLLRQADIALYNAKSLGRDRVVLWQEISLEQRSSTQVLVQKLAEDNTPLSHRN
ncbi:MAG TPA: GGDEF domain-containing protein, partial [bacterium]|nr:GGDEF domain-containing protein [bacterium]